MGHAEATPSQALEPRSNLPGNDNPLVQHPFKEIGQVCGPRWADKVSDTVWWSGDRSAKDWGGCHGHALLTRGWGQYARITQTQLQYIVI
jgi:hypothetical protein